MLDQRKYDNTRGGKEHVEESDDPVVVKGLTGKRTCEREEELHQGEQNVLVKEENYHERSADVRQSTVEKQQARG